MMSMPRSPVIYVDDTRLARVQKEWATVANVISEFEPVIMVIPPGEEGARLKPLFSSGVQTLPFDYDDGWLRDNGPIVVLDPERSTDQRVGLDFDFNGWGGAFDKWGQTWHRDDALPEDLCDAVGIASRPIDFVLEGGALQGDGAGVLMTTEECLLNPNRNPGMTKEQIEAALLDTFNATKAIWLPYGLIGDLTSGHIDGVAMFIGPGHVIAQTTRKPTKERDRLQANLDVLRSSTDANGDPLKVDELPLLPVGRFGSLAKMSFTYVNFGFTNGGLVVGTTGTPRFDAQGLAAMRDFVPDREVVGVPVPTINWAGGGVHCITQALPRAS